MLSKNEGTVVIDLIRRSSESQPPKEQYEPTTNQPCHRCSSCEPDSLRLVIPGRRKS